MSPIEHAPTETNGSIAAPDTNGRYVVYTSTQALFFSVDTCAKILDVPSNTFHFIGGTVGGGFGGKVDTLTEPLCILAAMLTGRPVRYVFGREEEMQYGPPRGAERIYIKDGVMRDGRVVARKVRAYFDSGAYTRLSSYAAVKCAAHLPGPARFRTSTATSIACSPTARRRPPCAASASPRWILRSSAEMDKLANLVGMESDGVPDSERLSRWRHEGASARGQEHSADRMRPGRGRKGEVAAARGVSACFVAPGWRWRPRHRARDTARNSSAARLGCARRHDRLPTATREPPPPAPPPPAPPRPPADRATIRPEAPSRVADSVESALSLGRGVLHVAYPVDDVEEPRWRTEIFSQHFACDAGRPQLRAAHAAQFFLQ